MTMSCPRFPKDGETVKGKGFRSLHGGKGANQAIGVSRLGGEAVFCSCVGEDAFGTAAVDMLRAEGIDVSHVKRSAEASTGVGFVMVAESGSNEIVIDLGANELLTPADIEAMEATIASSDVVLVQLESNLQAVARALELAKRHGVMAILNPAPYQDIGEQVIRNATIITPNETEAAALLKAGNSAIPPSGPGLARALHERYGVSVVVTLGPQGAYIKTDQIDEASPTYEIDPVDTTGAGDTFSAALAVALGEGKTLPAAVAFANKASSHSIAIPGVVESIPDRSTVETVALERKKEA